MFPSDAARDFMNLFMKNPFGEPTNKKLQDQPSDQPARLSASFAPLFFQIKKSGIKSKYLSEKIKNK